MPRIPGRTLLWDVPSAKVDTVFCVRMRLVERRAHDRHLYLHPKRDLSCPATTIKTTIPGAGATVPRAARAARASLGGPTRNSPSAVLRARRKASGVRMPESATIVRRAAKTAMRRGLASDRPYGDRPSRGGEGEKRSFRPRDDRGGDKRPYTPRGDRPDRDARPAARFQDRKFGDKKPYTPREGRREAALHAARRGFPQRQ